MRETQRTEYGRRLVGARKHAKLTQVQLAKAVGMSQGALGEAETSGQGSSFTPQIAAVCGISAKWLATGEGPMTAPAAWWPFTHVSPEEIESLSDEVWLSVENFTLWKLGRPQVLGWTQSLTRQNRPTEPDGQAVGFTHTDGDKQRGGHTSNEAQPSGQRGGGAGS